MVNAQKWLDRSYPKESRESITKLDISSKKLKGFLKLEEFTNLEELDCSNNKITGIDFSELTFQKLRFLNLSSNNFLNCDLSFLGCFLNLEVLSVSNNNWKKAWKGCYNGFNGSLEHLKNMNKLLFLDIEGTDIESGLEHLPASVEIFLCSGRNRPLGTKVERIQDKLYPYNFDIREWRANELNQLNNFSVKRDEKFYQNYIDFLLSCVDEFASKTNSRGRKILLASLEAFKAECTSDGWRKEFRETNKVLTLVCEATKDMEELVEENKDLRERFASIREAGKKLLEIEGGSRAKNLLEDLEEQKKKNKLLTQQLEKYLGSEELVAQVLQEVNQEFIYWKNNN